MIVIYNVSKRLPLSNVRNVTVSIKGYHIGTELEGNKYTWGKRSSRFEICNVM